MSSDKDIPKNKNRLRRFMSVYIWPILLGLAIWGLLYFLILHFGLDKNDRFADFIISISAAMVLYFRNTTQWLPLSPGSYVHIKELGPDETEAEPSQQRYFNEPTHYEAAFYYSTVTKIILLAMGLIMGAFGVYMIRKTSVFFPLLIVAGGIFLFYSGLKEIIYRSPKLKLAKEGLWTKKLGFRPWTSIRKTTIVKEKSSRFTNIYLEIYSKDRGSDYPAERLEINELNNLDKIKPMIDELFKG